jgi:YD repeat-containing protein
MNNLTVVLIAVIAVLGGFYGGFRYESGKVATTASAAATPATAGGTGRTGNGTGTFPGGGAGGAGGGAGFGGGRGNAGTITNLTSTGFTLHSANGTDTKVTFASGATVRKTVAGQLTDLTNTATVTVTGTRDASGNLVATTITIVPVPAASPAG